MFFVDSNCGGNSGSSCWWFVSLIFDIRFFKKRRIEMRFKSSGFVYQELIIVLIVLLLFLAGMSAFLVHFASESSLEAESLRPTISVKDLAVFNGYYILKSDDKRNLIMVQGLSEKYQIRLWFHVSPQVYSVLKDRAILDSGFLRDLDK